MTFSTLPDLFLPASPLLLSLHIDSFFALGCSWHQGRRSQQTIKGLLQTKWVLLMVPGALPNIYSKFLTFHSKLDPKRPFLFFCTAESKTYQTQVNQKPVISKPGVAFGVISVIGLKGGNTGNQVGHTHTPRTIQST